MDDFGIWVAVAVTSYLLGSFPTAYVLAKRFAGKNILDWGTGNVGTLNVHRATNSKILTLLTLAGDVLKATLAILVGVYLAKAVGLNQDTGASIGGIAAVAGHNYSIFLGFRGGKGITPAAALLVYLDPILAGPWILAFLATVAITRILVLGQIVATIAVPIVASFAFPEIAVAIYFLAALVFIRHAPRIKNVLTGTEPKMYYKIQKSQ